MKTKDESGGGSLVPCSSHPPAMAFPPTAQCDWSLSQNRTLHDFPHEEPSPPRTPATPARCKASGSLRQTDPRLARARWLRALGSHLPISASVPTVLGPGEGRGGGARSCCLLTAHCVLCILGPQSSPTGTSVQAECLPWEQWAQGAVISLSVGLCPLRRLAQAEHHVNKCPQHTEVAAYPLCQEQS